MHKGLFRATTAKTDVRHPPLYHLRPSEETPDPQVQSEWIPEAKPHLVWSRREPTPRGPRGRVQR